MSAASGGAAMQAVQIAMLKQALDAARQQAPPGGDAVMQAAAAQPALATAAAMAGRIDTYA